MIEIKDKKDCCGCEACYNICPSNCISMVYDEEGFKFPCINQEKCINCKKCEKVCPILHKNVLKNDFIKGYAAININLAERLQSSSGGIFCLLATQVIDSGGIVAGSAMTEDCKYAEHILVERVSDLKYLCGSKYLQSNINNIYRRIRKELENDKMVLFSGTPCQIVALQNYLGKPFENLICIDLICHGVPSPGLWENNVGFLEKKTRSSIKEVNFRCKKYYGNSEYGILYRNNKSYYRSKGEDSYLQFFLKNLSLRLSCYDCKFKGISRNSDITLGDFWGIEEFAPALNDGKGVSIVVIQSDKGEKLFERIYSSLRTKEVDVKKVFERHNDAMIRSATIPKNRKEFWKDYKEISYAELCRKYISISFKEQIKVVLRRMMILNIIRKIRRRSRMKNL